jgi:hypothetical protein
MSAKPVHPIVVSLIGRETDDPRRMMKSKIPGDMIIFEDVMAIMGPSAFDNIGMDYLMQVTGIEYNGDELGPTQDI